MVKALIFDDVDLFRYKDGFEFWLLIFFIAPYDTQLKENKSRDIVNYHNASFHPIPLSRKLKAEDRYGNDPSTCCGCPLLCHWNCQPCPSKGNIVPNRDNNTESPFQITGGGFLSNKPFTTNFEDFCAGTWDVAPALFTQFWRLTSLLTQVEIDDADCISMPRASSYFILARFQAVA